MQRFRSDRPYVLDTLAPFPKMGLGVLAAEPSLFSSSPAGVRTQGGDLSRIALKHIEDNYGHDIKRAEKEGLSAVVDVRVQRLMVGMYPSIPGWHCDAVPRSNHNGQPDFALINPAAFHVCVLLSSEHLGVSNTQYVDNDITFKLFDKEHVYQDLHREVEKKKPDILHARDGLFVKFSPRTVHRAMPTTRRGWRMFLRFSMYHKPPLQNAKNPQQQVYLLSEENGW